MLRLARPTSVRMQLRTLATQASAPAPAQASAQTLTLFSTSASGLLIALRSTLTGMLSSPSLTPRVLLYALSKHLPSSELSSAISLLRTSNGDDTITRVGLLCSSPPASLIGEGSGGMYSVALSLLPGAAFRSTVAGRGAASVGRWLDRKEAWRSSPSTDEEMPWRAQWGRANISASLPSELESTTTKPETIVFFSDNAPQGLVEGLAVRFPQARVLGLQAPPTPFETGRDLTLLHSDSIHSTGAVGLSLPLTSSVEYAYPALVPFGKSRRITSARGNIISTLSGENAAQQFLRDVNARNNPAGREISFDEAETRRVAAQVSKDEDFFVRVSNEQGRELLVARVLSGHPGRGTISLETEAELGPGPEGEQGSMRTEAQFLMRKPGGIVEPLEIPGKDPGVWAKPRFLFLSHAAEPPAKEEAQKDGKQSVMALPNLFVACSERGWIAGPSASTSAPSNVTALDPNGGSIISSSVPLSRATLSLN